MVLRTPKVFRETVIGNNSGHPGTYIGLIRHGADKNRKIIETELEEVSRKIDPQDQLHLVEAPSSGLDENKYLHDFAYSNKVEVADPISNPFTIRMAEKARVREYAPLAVLVLDHLGDIEQGQIEKLSDDELEEFFRLSLDSVSRAFGVSVKKLESSFLKLSFDELLALQDEINFLYGVRQGLIDKSNEGSKRIVANVLDKNPKKHVFAVSGAAHFSVFVKRDFAEIGPQAVTRDLKIYEPNQNISPLRKKLLAIQEIINAGRVQILAGPTPGGSMPSDHEWHCVAYINNKFHEERIDWKDFLYLLDLEEDYYSVRPYRAMVMEAILKNVAPEPVVGRLYSESNLMHWATDNPGSGSFFSRLLSSHPDEIKEAAIVSARILGTILKSIGDSLPDEPVIIQKLLNAPVPEIRQQVALALWDTYSHGWRKRFYETGLLQALKNEGDPYMHSLLIRAIGRATEQSIIEGINVDYLTDSRLTNAVVAHSKGDHGQDKSWAFYLMREICGRSDCIDQDTQGLFICNVDSSDFYLQNNSLRGLSNILRRKSFVDQRLEIKLLKCVKQAAQDENSLRIKNLALTTMGRYIERSSRIPPGVDTTLIDCLERGEDSTKIDSSYAICSRLKIGVIKDPRLVPLFVQCADSNDDDVRRNIFFAIGLYFLRGGTYDPRIRQVVRRHLNNEAERITRQNAVFAFANLLPSEPKLDKFELDQLLSIGYKKDEDEQTRVYAAYAISEVARRNPDEVIKSDEYLHAAHILCARHVDSLYLGDKDKKVINESFAVLDKRYQEWKSKLRAQVADRPEVLRMVEEQFYRDDTWRGIVTELNKKVEEFNLALLVTQARMKALLNERVELTNLSEQLKDDKKELEKALNELMIELQKHKRHPVVEHLVLPSGFRYAEYLLKYRELYSTKLVSDLGWHTLVRLPLIVTPLAFPGAGEAVDVIAGLLQG